MRALSLASDAFVSQVSDNGSNGIAQDDKLADVMPLPVEVYGEVVDVPEHQETIEATIHIPEPTQHTHTADGPVHLPAHNGSQSAIQAQHAASNGAVPLDKMQSTVGRKTRRRKERWWMHVIRRKPANASPSNSQTSEARAPSKKERIRWWMWLTSSIAFWKTRSQIIPSTKPKTKERRHSKEESVLLPPELPLEEIAKEVVKLKTVTDKDEEERMNRVYAEAVERSDRKWIMLLCFLIALSIGMLSVVAMRIGPI